MTKFFVLLHSRVLVIETMKRNQYSTEFATVPDQLHISNIYNVIVIYNKILYRLSARNWRIDSFFRLCFLPLSCVSGHNFLRIKLIYAEVPAYQVMDIAVSLIVLHRIDSRPI